MARTDERIAALAADLDAADGREKPLAQDRRPDFRSGVKVIGRDGHAEVLIGDVGEPIVVKPGDVFEFDYRLSHGWEKREEGRHGG